MLSRTAVLAAVLLRAAVAAGQTHVLTVNVSGFDADEGQAVLALYSDPAAFPTKPERAIATQRAAISGRAVAARFEGLTPGWYAVAVYHDKNSNGRLDTRIFGIPKEPTGASNDARGSMGPPKFADAKFEVKGDLTIAIRMQ
jgi:uncharacterized protein (DUF2141 family)